MQKWENDKVERAMGLFGLHDNVKGGKWVGGWRVYVQRGGG